MDDGWALLRVYVGLLNLTEKIGSGKQTTIDQRISIMAESINVRANQSGTEERSFMPYYYTGKDGEAGYKLICVLQANLPGCVERLPEDYLVGQFAELIDEGQIVAEEWFLEITNSQDLGQ